MQVYATTTSTFHFLCILTYAASIHLRRGEITSPQPYERHPLKQAQHARWAVSINLSTTGPREFKRQLKLDETQLTIRPRP